MITFRDISIIIPVGPEENELEALLEDLQPVKKEAEIVIIKGSARATQLNEGAQKATRDFLWFLHADSRFSSKTLKALLESLSSDPNALYYFDLRFLPDGPPLMFINEIGCWIRSHVLGVPFGDQGFCLSQENFALIGGFPEDVSYGEDHVFVWRARQKGVALRSTKAVLKTSARKYRDQGWLKTTLLHYKLWTDQARSERKKCRSTALAIFVKTPGLTPIKTRLAQTVGERSALQFYDLCLKAMKCTALETRKISKNKIQPYWVVAEDHALDNFYWKDLDRSSQGGGGLGERLHNVYSKLISQQNRVILIGADAPQLTADIIFKAHQILQEENKFVIGPARDGGFYLFGGSAPLPKEMWESITYSQSKTCEELVAKIKNYGEVVYLPQLSDVDVYDDLLYLKDELKNMNIQTQKEILNWIEENRGYA